MATIWPAPGGGVSPVVDENLVADAVEAMVTLS
jgi:hypothetical protein